MKSSAWQQYNLANALYGAGQVEESLENYQQAIHLFDQLAQQLPDHHRPHHFIAFVLSTCPAKQLRDPSRAARHAERALQLVPDNPDYWVTLATAQNVGGDHAAAISSMQEAKRRYQGRLPMSGKLVLAMAYHQLGEIATGRDIYEQVVTELADESTYSFWYTIEFRALLAEAEQRLVPS